MTLEAQRMKKITKIRNKTFLVCLVSFDKFLPIEFVLKKMSCNDYSDIFKLISYLQN